MTKLTNISFKSQEGQSCVWVAIWVGHTNKHIWAKFAVADETQAAVLADALQNQFSALIRDLRRNQYEQGYKDGRSKKRKKTWFCSGLGGC